MKDRQEPVMPSSADDLRLRLSEALFAIEPALNNWLKMGFRARGVTYARLRLMSALRYGGPRRMRDLGAELGVTARNVTGLVDALQREGLVERMPHPGDRRATLVRLTPAGERITGELLAEQRAALAGLFAELPEAQQRSLLQALESLRAVLARHPEV
jgi:DNA-binding MarR family transcriptional regulator